MVHDPIHKPAHYTHTAIQPLDVIEAWAPTWPADIAPHLSNVIKYAGRCGLKNKLVEDLQKMARYATRAAEIMDAQASALGDVSKAPEAPADDPTRPEPVVDLREPLRLSNMPASPFHVPDTDPGPDVAVGDFVEVLATSVQGDAYGRHDPKVGSRGWLTDLPGKGAPYYSLRFDGDDDAYICSAVRLVAGARTGGTV